MTEEREKKESDLKVSNVSPGMKGWNNYKELKETTEILKESVGKTTNKQLKEINLKQIQKYEMRCKQLEEKTKLEESRDDEEQMDADEKDDIEIPKWEDVE